MRLAVKVLHNESRDRFWTYHPDTSALFHAHDLTIEADNVDLGAETVFWLTNVGDEAGDPQALDYRRRMNRSLSVGDVLIFHEHYQGQLHGSESWRGIGTGYRPGVRRLIRQMSPTVTRAMGEVL